MPIPGNFRENSPKMPPSPLAGAPASQISPQKACGARREVFGTFPISRVILALYGHSPGNINL